MNTAGGPLSFSRDQKLVDAGLHPCQSLRQETAETELALFEQYTQDLKKIRHQLEERYEKEEASLKTILKTRLQNVQRAFASSASHSELKLAQRCLSSPCRESLCTRDSRAQCDFPMRAESSLCWLSLRLQGKPWDNTKVSFAGRKRTRMYSSLDPVRPSSAFQLASPVVEHQYQDVGAKSYPSGQALGEQHASMARSSEDARPSSARGSPQKLQERVQEYAKPEPPAPMIGDDTEHTDIRRHLLQDPGPSHDDRKSAHPKGGIKIVTVERLVERGPGFDEVAMRKIEREEDAAQTPSASSAEDLESPAGLSQPPAPLSDIFIDELSSKDCRRKVSWYMWKQKTKRLKPCCKRVITQKLWDDAGVSNLDLSQVPQRFEMQDHPCGDQITAMKSNLADLWVEDADLDLGFDTMWQLKLQDHELQRQCVRQCQHLLKNREQMLQFCKLEAGAEGDGESETTSSEGTINDFGIRENLNDADSGEKGKVAATEEDDAVLPLWAFDLEDADPGDIEELTEDEDGNLIRDKERADDGLLSSEVIRRAQDATQTLAESEEIIRQTWSGIASIVGLDSGAGKALADDTLQRSQALVSKQHFNGRAALVQLETLCDLLASYMAKWQDKRLPKLLRKDILRWHSRETHLPVWLEEDSHIKGRLVRDAVEILFASGTQTSLVRETMRSFKRRCTTLEITLSDILDLQHFIALAKSPTCPEELPQKEETQKKGRKLSNLSQKLDGSDSEDGYSESDSWLEDDLEGNEPNHRFGRTKSDQSACQEEDEEDADPTAGSRLESSTRPGSNQQSLLGPSSESQADDGEEKGAAGQDASPQFDNGYQAESGKPESSHTIVSDSVAVSELQPKRLELTFESSEAGRAANAYHGIADNEAGPDKGEVPAAEENIPSPSGDENSGDDLASQDGEDAFKEDGDDADLRIGQDEAECDSEAASEEEDESQGPADSRMDAAKDLMSDLNGVADSQAERCKDRENASDDISQRGEATNPKPGDTTMAMDAEIAFKQQLVESTLATDAEIAAGIVFLEESPTLIRKVLEGNDGREVYVLSDSDSEMPQQSRPRIGWRLKPPDRSKRDLQASENAEPELSEGPVQTKKRARIADDQKAENSTEDVEEEEAEEEAASLGEEAEVSDGEGKQGHAEASHGMNEPTKTRQKPKRRKRRRRRKGAISNGESSEGSAEISDQGEAQVGANCQDKAVDGAIEDGEEDQDGEFGLAALETQNSKEGEGGGSNKVDEEASGQAGNDTAMACSGAHGESSSGIEDEDDDDLLDAPIGDPAARGRRAKRRRGRKGKKVDKHEAARRAADTRRQNQLEKRQDQFKRALERTNLREEQRALARENDAENDEGFVIEPGYLPLLVKGSKQWQIDENLGNLLKPHQWEGVRHMWYNLVIGFGSKGNGSDEEAESEEDDEGDEELEEGGCILAHSMGLGKTLQTIAFLHTYHKHFPSHRSLLVMPKNVIYNWKEEFDMWLSRAKPSQLTRDKVFMTVNERTRLDAIRSWSETPSSALLITYETFTLCTDINGREAKIEVLYRQKDDLEDALAELEKIINEYDTDADCGGLEECQMDMLVKFKREYLKQRSHLITLDEKIAEKESDLEFHKTNVAPVLLNKADVVVADEGHEIKNPQTARAKALMKIKTKKRLALTGYPLQNRLLEYYTMVNWTQEGLLDSEEEFKTSFVLPITLGQNQNATPEDWKQMQNALCVLQDIVKDCVHRVGPDLLEKELPKRTEFAIFFRLSKVQEQLYKKYLEVIRGARNLFRDKELLKTLCNSPTKFVQVLKEASQGQSQTLATVVDNMCAEANGMDNGMVDEVHKTPNKKQRKEASRLPPEAAMRLLEVVPESGFAEGYRTPKINFAMNMIDISLHRGDKIVIFSSSLDALRDVVSILEKDKDMRRNVGYLQLDGRTAASERVNSIKKFADPKGPKIFLLSTKAGSLGINLIAANRMVVIDELWNPVHNAQAVARIFRYGQKRKTFIYRLVWDQTMEFRTYRRNLDKEGLARRVVDHRNIKGVNTEDDTELYCYLQPERSDYTSSAKVVADADDDVLGLFMQEGEPQQHAITLVENHQELMKDDPTLALSKRQRRRAGKKHLQKMTLRVKLAGPEPTQRETRSKSFRVLQKRHKIKAQRVDSSSEESEVDDSPNIQLNQERPNRSAGMLPVHAKSPLLVRPPKGFRRLPLLPKP